MELQMELHFATCLSDLPNVFQDYPLDNKDLEVFYKETIEIRTGEIGMSPIENIYDACHFPTGRNAHLLLGHRGCGKSTELNHLAMRLRKDGFPVTTIYCDKELDRSNMVYSDILVLMAEALVAMAKENRCKIPRDCLEVLHRFRTEIENVDTVIKEADMKIEDGMSLESPKVLSGFLQFFISLKASLKFNQESRVTIREKVQTRVSEWLIAIDTIAGQISKKVQKQPVLIFEDLDKGNAWDVFHLHSEQLTGVHFPTIYTFPIGLSYSPEFSEMDSFFDTKRLPMIKIRDIKGDVYQSGVDVIASIIKSRADENLFEAGVIDYLIDMTGGSLRDLFSAIREAAFISKRRKQEQISLTVARLALREIKSRLKIRIDKSDYAFLKAIYQDHTQFSDREKLLKMMQAGVVLEYNGDLWYNLHPLIEEFLRENGDLES